jgi:hypothetical protein
MLPLPDLYFLQALEPTRCRDLAGHVNRVISHRAREGGLLHESDQQILRTLFASSNIPVGVVESARAGLIRAKSSGASAYLAKEWPSPPRLTMPQLMACSSHYHPGSGFSYTAVVTFYRRLDVVPRMLDALLAQSVLPQEIWVTWWASPVDGQLRQVLEDFCALHSPCTHHALTMHSPCTHHALTMHSPCTHHALTVHSPCTHHALTTGARKFPHCPARRGGAAGAAGAAVRAGARGHYVHEQAAAGGCSGH